MSSRNSALLIDQGPSTKQEATSPGHPIKQEWFDQESPIQHEPPINQEITQEMCNCFAGVGNGETGLLDPRIDNLCEICRIKEEQIDQDLITATDVQLDNNVVDSDKVLGKVDTAPEAGMFLAKCDSGSKGETSFICNATTVKTCNQGQGQYSGNVNSALKEHIQGQSYEKLYRCTECKYSSKLKNGVTSHMKYVHSLDRPFRCPQCQYSSKSKSNLQQHIKLVHTYDRPFSCTQCQNKFKTDYALKKHNIQVHSDERPFRCPQCPSSFKLEYTLTQHLLQVHSDKRRYSCPQCQYSCNFNYSLKRHINRIHSDKNTFCCTECKYSCKSLHTLNRHIDKFHSVQTLFRCSQCQYQCNVFENLTQHIQISHKQEPIN